MSLVVDASGLQGFGLLLASAARRLGERERALFELSLTLAGGAGPEPADLTLPDILGPEADPVAGWLTGALACGVYGGADTTASPAGLHSIRPLPQPGDGPALALMSADDERARRGPVLALVGDAGEGEPRAVFSARGVAGRGPVLEVMDAHPDDPVVRTVRPPRPTPIRALIGPKPEDPRTGERAEAARAMPFDADQASSANLLAGWGFRIPGRGDPVPINGDALASFGRALTNIAGSSPVARACALLLTLRASRGSVTGPVAPGLLSGSDTELLSTALLGDAGAAPRSIHLLARGDEQWQRALLRRLT